MEMKIYDKIQNAKIKNRTRLLCQEALQTALEYLVEHEDYDTLGNWIKSLSSEDKEIRVPTEDAIQIILQFIDEI